MSKIIRLTEADLTRIVRRVMNEQSQIVTTTSQPPKTKTTPGQINTVVSSKTQSNPMDWFNQFPCLKSPEVKINGGKAIFKGKVLLPEPVKYDSPDYEEISREKAYKKMVGRVQGRGWYFCDASYPEFLAVKSF
jgi:hypothetical protein